MFAYYAGYGAAILGAFGGLAIFQSVSDYLLASMAQSVRHDLRMRLFTHLQTLDMAFFESRQKGDLLSVVTGDVDTLNGFFAETTANMVRIVIAFGGTYGYLLWLDWRLAALLLPPLPLAFIAIKIFSGRIQPKYLQSRKAIGAFSGILENSLQGMAILQAYSAEEHEAARLRAQSADYRDTAITAAKVRAGFIPVVYLIAGLSYATLISVGGWLTTTENGPGVGAYTTFVLMAMRLVVPIFTLGFIVNQVQQAKASVTRIAELLDTEPSVQDANDAVTLQAPPETIEFTNVSFAYAEREESISNLSISIGYGQFIGIAGPTGAGKSTLLKLLLRFYPLESGTITVNGTSLCRLAIADFRQHIGYVSQDAFLFHGTVIENIRLGMVEADEQKVMEAAKLANADQFIRLLPQGYDTIVGDRGERLSGGQRQRISLARALLRDPAVLILDEATSAVDATTEKAILDSVLALRKGRIVIAVAHRLSTLEQCDTIYVLNEGKLSESGTHDELLAKGALYAKLWQALMVEEGKDFDSTETD